MDYRVVNILKEEIKHTQSATSNNNIKLENRHLVMYLVQRVQVLKCYEYRYI